MVSRCVNRNCHQPLTSLSEGRLFQFEIVSISVSVDDSNKKDFDETPSRETMHFWLCGPCSSSMTLALEPLEGLRLIPLEHAMAESMVQFHSEANPGRRVVEQPLFLETDHGGSHTRSR
jgi:hypothetical protein